MATLRFERRTDALTYDFALNGAAEGYPVYKRTDSDVWCRRLAGIGWAVCTDSGNILARPFASAGEGALPPEGMWVSAKDDQSYVYDMTKSGDSAHPVADSLDVEPAALAFSVPITARGYEVDANGHVPATTLLAYAQHARWQCLRAAGVDAHGLQRGGVGPISLEEKIRFHHELRPGDEINVSCTFVWTDSTRTFRVEQQLRGADGTLVAEVTNVGGLLDLTERRLIHDPAQRWRLIATTPELLGL
jgi:acyl-CoA thioester hydrolase